MQRVTLRIIAEKCGVSKFAVSRALAGKSGVSEATRTQVMAVAAQLGYQRPVNRARRTIAALFEDPLHVNGELHSQVQAGMQSEAARLGYEIQPHWLHHGDRVQEMLDTCVAIATNSLQDRGVLEKVAHSGKPAVNNGWLAPLTHADTVGGTDRESASAVGRYLFDLGHRQIVYVHGPIDLRGRRERLWGIREALDLEPDCMVHDMLWKDHENFSGALDALLARGCRPTAFFCAHDGLALTAVTDMLARGWSIPGDVSVVGFGDFSAAQQIRPPLTTVRIPGYEIGRTMVRQLHVRLSDDAWPSPPLRLQVFSELIARNSTGPAPRF